MNRRRLLLDAGNTRLKWAVVEAGVWLAHGSAQYDDLSELHQVLEQKTACSIASVVRAQHEDKITVLLKRYSITPSWLTTGVKFNDVINTYLSPQQLGIDRWMALIAARERTQSAALVVSVGTAMTVDALAASGEFLGGLIVPGVAMMKQALQQGTAQVTEVAGTAQTFPRETADAVHSGIMAAMCGAVRTQYGHLAQAAGKQPRCILTGGDAERVLPHLGLAAELAPLLVLEGIERVTRESEMK